MPKVANYRTSSVIYFQGDMSDKIFVLQGGKVSLNYIDIESGKDAHELIQNGEFFGVKSAMGKYPREENAVVLQDAMVLVFTVPEFEAFSMANIRIIMKMLKVFSTQLRRVLKQVENLMERGEAESPELGLYKTGEYYLKNRMYSQAKYVFGRYLTYYPAGKMAEQASKYLESSESAAVKYGDGKGPSPVAPERGAKGPENLKPAAGKTLSDAAKDYYNAVSLFTQEKYKEALGEFKRIVDEAQDEEYVSKAVYDMGRSLYQLGLFDHSIKHFTQLVQSYPKHPDLLDTLFYLGMSYEKKGDTERAKGFYKKILAMEKDEDASTHMKAKRALKNLEASNG